jgi:hypothetical protein
MRPIKTGAGSDAGLAPVKTLGAAVALCAALAACPAIAQEGGADRPQVGDGAVVKGRDPAPAAAGDIEPAAPPRSPAGLWRRANIRALIANAPGRTPDRTAALPAASVRGGPLPVRPPIPVSVPRNAIGLAVAAPPPGHGAAAATAGTGPAGGSNAGRAARQAIVPVNAPAFNAGGINGTAMNRASGAIGGPARDRSRINGTLMRPK